MVAGQNEVPGKRGPGRPRRIKPMPAAPVTEEEEMPQLIDRSKLAAMLDVSKSTLVRMEKTEPDFPKSTMIGGKLKFKLAEVKLYVRQHFGWLQKLQQEEKAQQAQQVERSIVPKQEAKPLSGRAKNKVNS